VQRSELALIARNSSFRLQGQAARGWRYDSNGGGLTKTEDVPGFLAYTRVKAEKSSPVIGTKKCVRQTADKSVGRKLDIAGSGMPEISASGSSF
jgi:uncharacterized protein RhaS with RHS repeats